jgi:hypothetical protein
MKKLVLLSASAQAAQDRRFLNLATWMGISTRLLAIQDGRMCTGDLLGELHPGPSCLAMSADTLAVLHEALTSARDLPQLVDKFCEELLIFGCSGSTEQNRALSWLTAGVVCGVSHEKCADTLFAFPMEGMAFSQQLAGLHFSRQNAEAIPVFLTGAVPVSETIVTANDRPMFVRIERRASQIFLLAGPPLAELNQPLRREDELEGQFDRLIPAMIFLRHSLREKCWHGPEPTARLIIDDPLLTKRYGFLDYDMLLKSMHRHNYGTSIAFIPWNYWRTSRRSASRLLGERSNLSVCIHGCDHTNKEFEAPNQALLARKAGLAMQRMEFLRTRISREFERVMVFPQGRFATAAIPALRANNYLAAVNTTCFPTNSGLHDITVGDFLRPAITRYNGFPIFRRRYPRRLFDFAFDLFLGRPALAVEHHEYFRDGVGALEEFVAALYQMQPDLTWPSLTSQLIRSCQMRSVANGSTEVQFFTRKFQLVHREAVAGRFLLSKHEPDSAAIQMVLVDGTTVPFSFEKGFLKLEVQADYPNQVLNIDIVDREHPQQQGTAFGILHNSGVLLRRGLSELRDNTLARHRGLLKIAKEVATRLKVTGDS